MFKGKTALVTGSTSGIGLGIATRFAAHGANVVLNGFGDAAEIETLRAELAAEHRSRCATTAPTCRSQDTIEAMMGKAIERVRRDRRPRQQRRHPARRAGRRIPGRQVGRDHRDQPDRVVPHDAPRAAGDEGEELGPDHQHRLGARAGREPVQVGLRGREARHRRPDQDRGARSREHGITMNAICPGLRLDAARRKADSRHRESARPHRGAGDQRRAAAAQPTKKFVQVDEVAALAAFLASRGAASITGAMIPVDGGWTAQ